MSPRLCTSCPLPHVTTDWYVIEDYHPHAGDIECADAHERRIPLEVRDFGTSTPPKFPSRADTVLSPDLLARLRGAA